MRFLAAVFLATSLAWSAEPLRVSLTTMPVSAALVLAQETGLFRNAGLNVELREYALGKLALEDLSAGKLEVACAAVTPLVYKCMAGDPYKIIASISTSTGMVAVAARKDFGIEKIADIRGKRIGLAQGTSGEFFFETMRVLNRLPRDSVRVENRTLQGLMEGMQDGSLDAISIWEPQIQHLRSSLTNRLALFYGNGLYTFTWNLAVLPRTLETRRGDLEKFVDVLFDAGELIETNPEKASATLIERLGERGRELTLGFKEARFRPQLSQELLVQMEGEARWIINRDARTNTVPNFLRCLDTSILKKEHPSAITVIE